MTFCTASLNFISMSIFQYQPQQDVWQQQQKFLIRTKNIFNCLSTSSKLHQKKYFSRKKRASKNRDKIDYFQFLLFLHFIRAFIMLLSYPISAQFDVCYFLYKNSSMMKFLCAWVLGLKNFTLQIIQPTCTFHQLKRTLLLSQSIDGSNWFFIWCEKC